MMKPEGVPEQAEALDALPWMKTARKASALVQGVEQLTTAIQCPSCDTLNEAIYCAAFACAGCQLSMHMENYLFIWRDAEPAPKLRLVR